MCSEDADFMWINDEIPFTSLGIAGRKHKMIISIKYNDHRTAIKNER
jgi:hypothetical protein